MLASAEGLEFEKAAQLRDQLLILREHIGESLYVVNNQNATKTRLRRAGEDGVIELISLGFIPQNSLSKASRVLE